MMAGARVLASAVAAGGAVLGCAIPATDVAVPTQSMQQALRDARASHPGSQDSDVPRQRPAHGSAPPGAPRPALAAPDIRMAYLYDWIDREGNKHFGGWVAIPLAGFDWIMSDGSNAPLLAPAGPDRSASDAHR